MLDSSRSLPCSFVSSSISGPKSCGRWYSASVYSPTQSGASPRCLNLAVAVLGIEDLRVSMITRLPIRPFLSCNSSRLLAAAEKALFGSAVYASS